MNSYKSILIIYYVAIDYIILYNLNNNVNQVIFRMKCTTFLLNWLHNQQFTNLLTYYFNLNWCLISYDYLLTSG